MRKILIVAIIMVALLVPVVASPVLAPSAQAIEIPDVCAWATYMPIYASACIIAIIFEMGIDLWDAL